MENRIYYNPIKSFQDLVVYQNLYKTMVVVHKDIIPNLPREEKFCLTDQLRRSTKAAPALIAEGFAKRYQKRQWQKYINDAIGECNETIHHISVCKDLYFQYIDKELCMKLIDLYNISCKQLTKLGQSWQDYHSRDK